MRCGVERSGPIENPESETKAKVGTTVGYVKRNAKVQMETEVNGSKKRGKSTGKKMQKQKICTPESIIKHSLDT